jgi:hypothetical protein
VTFLYHYYNADDIIFLANLHKIIYQSDPNRQITLAFDKAEIEHAVENFENVAVVPTAVDVIQYDPEDYDPSLLDQAVSILTTPAEADDDLYDAIKAQGGRGIDNRLANVVEYANQNAEVDFFGVAVPDKNVDSGNLTPDGSGGFEVQGFERVIQWLK